MCEKLQPHLFSNLLVLSTEKRKGNNISEVEQFKVLENWVREKNFLQTVEDRLLNCSSATLFKYYTRSEILRNFLITHKNIAAGLLKKLQQEAPSFALSLSATTCSGCKPDFWKGLFASMLVGDHYKFWLDVLNDDDDTEPDKKILAREQKHLFLSKAWEKYPDNITTLTAYADYLQDIASERKLRLEEHNDALACAMALTDYWSPGLLKAGILYNMINERQAALECLYLAEYVFPHSESQRFCQIAYPDKKDLAFEKLVDLFTYGKIKDVEKAHFALLGGMTSKYSPETYMSEQMSYMDNARKKAKERWQDIEKKIPEEQTVIFGQYSQMTLFGKSNKKIPEESSQSPIDSPKIF